MFEFVLSSQAGSDGTGRLYLVGCGYNAYPSGSQYAEYPQMDNKQEDRQRRKYRFIIHAEQNALIFRWGDKQGHKTPPLLFEICSTVMFFLTHSGVRRLKLTSPLWCLWLNIRVMSVCLWYEELGSLIYTQQIRTKTKTRATFLTWGSAAWRTSASSSWVNQLVDVLDTTEAESDMFLSFQWQKSPSVCSVSTPHLASKFQLLFELLYFHVSCTFCILYSLLCCSSLQTVTSGSTADRLSRRAAAARNSARTDPKSPQPAEVKEDRCAEGWTDGQVDGQTKKKYCIQIFSHTHKLDSYTFTGGSSKWVDKSVIFLIQMFKSLFKLEFSVMFVSLWTRLALLACTLQDYLILD